MQKLMMEQATQQLNDSDSQGDDGEDDDVLTQADLK